MTFKEAFNLAKKGKKINHPEIIENNIMYLFYVDKVNLDSKAKIGDPDSYSVQNGLYAMTHNRHVLYFDMQYAWGSPLGDDWYIVEDVAVKK